MDRVQPNFLQATTVWADKPGALDQSIATLSDDVLLAGYNLDDLSDGARASLLAELQRRGHSLDAVANWVAPPHQFSVPAPAGRVDDGGVLRFFMGLFRLALMVLAPIIVILVAFAFGSNLMRQIEPERASFFTDRRDEQVVYLLVATLLYVALVVIGALIASRRPARVVLLRPFGERSMTRALKKVVKRQFDGLEPVITLSDRHYKPNPLLWLGLLFSGVTGLGHLLLAPFFRPSYRIASVKNSSSFLRFARRISGTFWPHVRTLLSRGQALNVRSSDHWWRRCVDLLLNSCNLIVMDVSKVSTGSTWEIHQIARRSLAPRTVFIVQEEYLAESRRILDELVSAGPSPTLHVFARDGRFRDAEAFRTDLKQKLVAGRQAETGASGPYAASPA